MKSKICFLLGATLGLFIAVGFFSGCSNGIIRPVKSPEGTTTTYILVRHAEKDVLSEETSLSEAGHRRAQILADTVAPMGVTAIYCPDLRRNKETVKPLADRLNIDVQTVPGWRMINTRKFADQFVRETMAEHAGGVILWAGNKSIIGGHGSNLQEIYLRLGGQDQGPRAYHDLFVIVVNETGTIDVQKRQYGQLDQ